MPELEVPPNPIPFPLRVPPWNVTSAHISSRTWFGRVLGRTSFSSKSLCGITEYGMPTGVGIPAGMVWGRRDVLAAPILFSSMFVAWAWYSVSADSFSSFAEQTHGNAKALRTMISPGLLAIARRWGFLKMCTVVFALMMAQWDVYRWVFGRKGIQTTVAPVPTNTLPLTASAQPTGAGVAEASPPSTEPTVSMDGEEVGMPIRISDNKPEEICHAQPSEASRLPMKGCPRQQLEGCVCREDEQGRFVLLEDDHNLNHAEKLDAYMRAKHGKECEMLINNKRCSRPGCWRRGSLREQDGKWLMEGSSHMPDHFKDPSPQLKAESPPEQNPPELTTEQLQPNWGKLPAAMAPSASSNQAPDDGMLTDGERK